MGAGKDIYEQNKALRLENDNLREQRQILEEKNNIAAAELAALAMRAANAFLSGNGCLIIGAGHEPGTHIVSFEMPAEPII